MNRLAPLDQNIKLRMNCAAIALEMGLSLVERHFFKVDEKFYFFDEISGVEKTYNGYLIYLENERVWMDDSQYSQVLDQFNSIMEARCL